MGTAHRICTLLLTALLISSCAQSEPVTIREHDCQGELMGLDRTSRDRIVEWGRQFGRVFDSPVTFNCYLGDRKYVVGLFDAPRADQGVYLLDLSKPLKTEPGSGQDRILGGISDVPKVFLDKSGGRHALVCGRALRSGAYSQACALLNFRSGGFTTLYSTAGPGPDPDAGGDPLRCLPNRSDYRVDRAEWFIVEARDTDGDRHGDIVVSVLQKNCKTLEKTSFERVFVATNDGFKEKR